MLAKKETPMVIKESLTDGLLLIIFFILKSLKSTGLMG